MDCYLGEIRPFALNFAPQGWLPCEGQLLTVTQNTALFSLLGIKFGGDGKNTFALPDLRGRSILGTGINPATGTYYPPNAPNNTGGSESITLANSQVPTHNHSMQVMSTKGNTIIPTNYLAVPDVVALTTETVNLYQNDSTQQVYLNPATVASNNGGQPHNNLQPFIAVKYCIATTGYYPPRP